VRNTGAWVNWWVTYCFARWPKEVSGNVGL
jgi:hypothetical protein